jgi:predicted DNA-binding protein (UPF0251 family)
LSIYQKGEPVKPRGRPRKKKIVHEQPRIDHFSPRGRPGRPEEAIITVEEYETIRLYDQLGMPQKKAAQMMGISQQSLSRIIRKAHKTIADAIVNAKIIRIEGGDYINKRSIAIADKLRRKE